MNLRIWLLGLSVPFFWGAGFTIAKPAVAHFPPLFMMLLIYGAIACVMVAQRGIKITTPPRAMLAISIFSVTAQGALVFAGLRDLDAATANLVLQTQVPLAVFFGWLLANEAMTVQKVAGTIVAFIGITIVIGVPQQPPPLWPVALLIVGAACWALGQVLAQKWGKESGLDLLRANAIYGVPQLAVATLLIESGQLEAMSSASSAQWAALVFVGLFGFYAAYVAWFTLLRQVPMNIAAPFVLLMIPFGLATAVLVLGENVTWAQMAGAAILLAGLAIVNGLVRWRTLPV
jgi:O-acetylserine/cysteine efflux transporter